MPDCIAHQQLKKGLPPVHREQWLPSNFEEVKDQVVYGDTMKPIVTTKWTPQAIAAFKGQLVTASTQTQAGGAGDGSQPTDAGGAGADPQESDSKLPAVGGSGGNGPSDGQGNGDSGGAPGGEAPGGIPPVMDFSQTLEAYPPIPEFIPSGVAEDNFPVRAAEAHAHILELYKAGCFLCPGGMQNLETRRPGAPWDRSKRNDPRFSLKQRSKVVSWSHEGGGGAAAGVAAGVATQLVGSTQNEEQWVDEAPFTWSNWVNVPADTWVLNQQYLEGVIRLLYLMKHNPAKVEWINTDHVWQMPPKMHFPLCKHSCQIIYFAIATQTGPLFEADSDEHQQIGHNPTKGAAWNQYEKDVATSLFHSLGVEPLSSSPSMLQDMCLAPKASTKQGQFNFNAKKRATFCKSFTLYLLGMSGKPGWDARLFKIPRPNARKRYADQGPKRSSTKKKKGTPKDPPPAQQKQEEIPSDNAMLQMSKDAEDSKFPAASGQV